jgi:hypothetical protein
LTLEASASDPDGTVQKVEYYLGLQKIGESAAAPYSVTWAGGLPGLCTLSAVATDNAGARSSAASVSFNILAPAPGPVSNLRASAVSASAIQLSWTVPASGQTGIRVYRSADGTTYSLRASLAGTAASWGDTALAASTKYFYRVAAYNPSGESAASGASAQTWSLIPPAPEGLQGAGQTQSILLTWNPVPGANSYIVKRSSAPSGPFFAIAPATANTSMQDLRIVKGLTYYYCVCAQAGTVASADSSVTTARLNSGTANIQFVGANTARKGTWKGSVGTDGYLIAGENRSIPSYAAISFSGNQDWIWQYTTSDPRAVQRSSGSTRLGACWYSGSAFDVVVNCKDAGYHRLALHCLDWDRLGRNQDIEIWDAVSGAFLHSCNVANFGEGVDIEYLVQGSIRIRVKNLANPNAVLNAIFLDPAN